MNQDREQLSEEHAAFVAELRHWREVAGYSQKALAGLVGYTPSYISKVEGGTIVPSRDFAESADRGLKAGQALIRRWRDLHAATQAHPAPTQRRPEAAVPDPQTAPGTALVVEHEHAELTLADGVYRTRVRRLLRNIGTEPVTRYLVRIAVDRYPGDPERSNQLYRNNPLTWEEVNLTAQCAGEPMAWTIMHDRDAFKEVWLQFENQDGRFPLYPGEERWIEYVYTVPAHKWGPWWQRAIRLPTRRLSLSLTLPADLDPVAWGTETSMTAEPSAFRTPIARESDGENVTFTWATSEPPLHTRFRIAWRFKAATAKEDQVDTLTPSDQMQQIGIVQEGDPILTTEARRFDLPAESEDARRVIAQMSSMMERAAQVHEFAKGMGIAAPQIGISRNASLVRTPDGQIIVLLNARVIAETADTDEQYEGCLSFFDVRGMVPRPHGIEVEHQDVDGTTRITAFTGGVARLVQHEIDHVYGLLYRARMRDSVSPIPVSQYKGTGKPWSQ
ncbi:peptide deformylase [Micromonospora coxensis]|uniref:Peptide deformylase n=1 Tax=Micromonospora coxensis TaxID=356852 RepID=A0A1C5JPQ9_9ACTN|nr:peptide deformylase [Micromonospora coxensis]SCG72321.1 peptide deformylase [Micromonospora coxensis]